MTFCGKELVYAIVARSTFCDYKVALNISGQKLTEKASVSRGQHRGHAMKKNGRRPRQGQQQSKRVMTTRQKTCIEV